MEDMVERERVRERGRGPGMIIIQVFSTASRVKEIFFGNRKRFVGLAAWVPENEADDSAAQRLILSCQNYSYPTPILLLFISNYSGTSSSWILKICSQTPSICSTTHPSFTRSTQPRLLSPLYIHGSHAL